MTRSTVRILVLHGPNLDRLGSREPALYGLATLAEIDARIRSFARSLSVATIHLQSNQLGELVEALHAAGETLDGVAFNPGAYTHGAWALRDAVASIGIPVVEVHLTEPRAREPWRQLSVLEDVAVARVAGKGVDGYMEAITLLVERARARSADAKEPR